jgi:acetyl esterase/lipase
MPKFGFQRSAAAACISVLAWLAGPAALAQSIANTAAPIPAAAFYGPAEIEGSALSPSGRWLAIATAKGGDRVGLYVFDLQEWKAVAAVARFSDADVNAFHWVNDDRLVFDIVDKTRGSGDQRWWPGLFSVSRDGKESRQLVKLERVFVSTITTAGREILGPNHQLLHVPQGGGNEVIVGEHRFDGVGEPLGIAPKRLNVLTGRVASLSFNSPAHAMRWLFDPQGEPRVVVTQHKGRGAVHWRAPGQDTWRMLAEYAAFEAPFTPLFTDAKGGLFVTQSSGKGAYAQLKRFDFDNGKPEAEALVSAPGFDFWGQIVSETVGSRALGVRVHTDAEATYWFDAGMKALQDEADKRFPGRVNRLTCRRCDEPDKVVAITSYSDRDPGQLWVHRAKDNSWRKVGEHRPAIQAAQMATVDFQRIRARDGLEIPLWVTTPKRPKPGPGDKPNKPPAVVLVHGGPWVRSGFWGWHADAQFLASRGYVVIEPEFRSSTGYGQVLFRAGWRQWGLAMQDDVADAVQWAIAQGLVDGSRVCIAGASYGGYATLMGLVRHPELYRCGAAWVAVTDPRLLLKWRHGTDQSEEVRQYSYTSLIGDAGSDAAMLDSVSPVLLAERIKAPVFLAFGGSDRRVLPVHGTRMRDALKEAGRPPEWVLYADEGHGWLKQETRLDFAQRLEDFFAKHLK